jgi:hypothetical protein
MSTFASGDRLLCDGCGEAYISQRSQRAAAALRTAYLTRDSTCLLQAEMQSEMQGERYTGTIARGAPR